MDATSDFLSSNAAQRIKDLRRSKIDAQQLQTDLLSGDRAALSRCITLIESSLPEHKLEAAQLLNTLEAKQNTVRLGITGVPGVGKSTFIEAFGLYAISKGYKVAVLAVDPSSQLTRGSILGDKTRMEELVKSESAFIRPSASGTTLGGVAASTREIITLCEAAGYNFIIIETVGVGQSETTVADLTDFFLLLHLAGAGDELQGIKRGIMEMADLIVINKTDGANVKPAKRAQAQLRSALSLFPPKTNFYESKVLTASALEHSGIADVFDEITTFFEQAKETGHFEGHRKKQVLKAFQSMIEQALLFDFTNNPNVKAKWETVVVDLETGKITPRTAVQQLLELYRNA